MWNRTCHLTALLLALLYGAIGLFGDALHCFFTSDAGEPGKAGAKSAIVYHCHGPDFHFHFHRHGDGATEHRARSDRVAAGRRPIEHVDRVALRRSRTVHDEHGCPLLVLLSTLKLGLGVTDALPFERVSACGGLSESLRFCASEIHSSSLARGPPGPFSSNQAVLI
jgi:hypothetical protein